jgi:hypothetical protein
VKKNKSLYHRKRTGRMIDCPGEAHKYPFIDHCMVCLPRWGKIPEFAGIDFAAAKAAGLDIPMPGLSEEEYAEVKRLEAAGEGEMIETSEGSSYFSAFRWHTKEE